MNAPTATLTPEAEVTAGDLAVLNDQTKVALLTDEKAFEDLLDKIRTEVRSHVPDLTTDKGRKAIASLAHKVTKTKTALDEAGKSLTEDLRKQVKTVDDSRRKIREKLDELRDEARKPLTDWEEAEEARQERVKAALSRLESLTAIQVDDDSDVVALRLEEAEAFAIDPDEFRETAEIAQASKARVVENLTAYHAKLLREEADRAELARLRREQEEREKAEAARREQERQEREEAERRQREEAEAAERQRRQEEAAARAKAEAEAAAQRAAEEAARKAREEAEAQARQEQEERERKHREELAEAQRRAEAAEAARKAEAEAQARREQEEKAKADAEAAAKAKREADAKHRATVMGAAKEALMKHAGIDEEAARQAVLAIRAGEVPHVSITF